VNGAVDLAPTSAAARPTPRRPAPLAAWAAGAGAVLAVVLARAMLEGRLPYPGCGFRWLTGRPCPACCGTHALEALGRGDTGAALASNPLVAAGALGLVALALVAAIDHVANRGRLAARVAARPLRRATIAWLITAAVLANWAYLVASSG